MQTDHPMLVRKPNLALINQKKKTELKKIWNIKMIVIPIVFGAPGTVPKNMEKKVGELKKRDHLEKLLLVEKKLTNNIRIMK